MLKVVTAAIAAGAAGWILARRTAPSNARRDWSPAAAPGAAKLLLLGKTVVVTGGSSGIGRAICRACAREGAHVVILDLRQEPLEGGETTEALIESDAAAAAAAAGAGAGAAGDAAAAAAAAAATAAAAAAPRPQVVRVAGDVSKLADVKRAVAAAVSLTGRLDVLVNNAAIDSGGQDLLATTEATWDRVLAVNAKGVMFGCQAAIEQMVTQAQGADELRGRVVNISSQHGMVCCPGDLAYGVGKATVVYMTRQIAADYAKRGIAVNAVAPGKIVTGFDGDNRPYSISRTPAPRLGRPDDVARAVVFLASEQATAFVTGVNLMCDGGWTAS